MEMLKRLEPLALLIMFLAALNWAILGITDGGTNVLSEVFGVTAVTERHHDGIVRVTYGARPLAKAG